MKHGHHDSVYPVSVMPLLFGISLVGFILRLMTVTTIVYLSLSHVEPCFSRTFTLNLFLSFIPTSLADFLYKALFSTSKVAANGLRSVCVVLPFYKQVV